MSKEFNQGFRVIVSDNVQKITDILLKDYTPEEVLAFWELSLLEAKNLLIPRLKTSKNTNNN